MSTSGQQVIDEGKLHFIDIVQIINEERVQEFKYYCFATLCEIMDAGNDHQ